MLTFSVKNKTTLPNIDRLPYDHEIGKYILLNKLYPSINAKTTNKEQLTPLMMAGLMNERKHCNECCFYLMCEMERRNLHISTQALLCQLAAESMCTANKI